MAFRKYSHYYLDSLVVIGYSFIEQSKLNNPNIITDISGTYQTDVSPWTNVEWSVTRFGN